MKIQTISARRIIFANGDEITFYDDNTGQFVGKMGSMFLNLFIRHKIHNNFDRFRVIKQTARTWSEKSNTNPISNIITEIDPDIWHKQLQKIEKAYTGTIQTKGINFDLTPQ